MKVLVLSACLILGASSAFAASEELSITFTGSESPTELRLLRTVLANSYANGSVVSISRQEAGACIVYADPTARTTDIETLRSISGMSSRLSKGCPH